MIPITYSTLLQLVLQYGPQIIPLVVKLVDNIKAGRGDAIVTEADWAELARLSTQTGEDIYKRLGITPPA